MFSVTVSNTVATSTFPQFFRTTIAIRHYDDDQVMMIKNENERMKIEKTDTREFETKPRDYNCQTHHQRCIPNTQRPTNFNTS